MILGTFQPSEIAKIYQNKNSDPPPELLKWQFLGSLKYISRKI